MEWLVFYESWNERKINKGNILNDYFIPTLKKLKKKSKDINEFSENMKREIMWRYWSKCEWELIIKREDNKIFLSSLFDRVEPIEVTNDNGINWYEFYDYILENGYYGKFDVYDQIMFRWNEFIDYCWYTRLPYERKSEKFAISKS